MSGGYISCGSWLGEDKSGSGFFEVLEGIEDIISEHEYSNWEESFSNPLREQLEDMDEDELPYMKINKAMLDVLIPLAKRYNTQLLNELGNPEAENWHETEEGWQLMCLADLFEAYKACSKSNKDVTVHFD